VPAAVAPDVRKDLLREELPGQILVRVEHDLVVLTPEAHHIVVAGLVDPVLEPDQGAGDLLEQRGGQERARRVEVHEAQQAGHCEIGAVPSRIYISERLPHARLIKRAMPQFEPAQLGEKAAPPAARLRRSRVLQKSLPPRGRISARRGPVGVIGHDVPPVRPRALLHQG